MRQVNRDEFVQRIQSAMRGLTPALVKGLHDHRPEVKLRARVTAATIIADKLSRLEILTDAPEGPPVHYADLEGGTPAPARDVIPVIGPQ